MLCGLCREGLVKNWEMIDCKPVAVESRLERKRVKQTGSRGVMVKAAR
jgi:hypothetical protein